MDTVINIGLILLFILAFIGSIHPAIPGPAFVLGAYALSSMRTDSEVVGSDILVVTAITVLVFAIDFMVPPFISKKMGGSKTANRGTLIGTIIGVIFMPFGFISIVLGPIIGALVGELMTGSDTRKSMKVALGAFLGFVLGVGIKMAFVGYYLIEVFF